MDKIKPKVGVIGLKGLPAIGGAATVGENIINKLSHKYIFSVYSISSHASSSYEKYGVNQIIFKKFPLKKINTFYYYIASVLHALFLAKYDLIHIHHADSGFFVLLLKLKYKIIGTTHGRGQFNDKWGKFTRLYLRYSESVFLNNVDYIVSVSKVDAEIYKNMTSNNIIHIPNGVNKSDITSIKKTNNQLKKIVFASGRIIPLKGCDLIIKAFHKGNIKNELTIIGDITHKLTYTKKLKKDSNGLNINFHGLYKDKKKLFDEISTATLFIFPSRKEAMSMMLLEVASLGVPIICSDIDANRAIFTESEVNFFQSESVDDLLKKILWVEKNYYLAIEKSIRAKNKLINNYTWENIAVKYSDLYENILNI